MKLTQEKLASEFVYKADGSKDTWRILSDGPLIGDCEDYALTALYIEVGHSIPKTLLSLALGRGKILACYSPNGLGHAVLQYKGECIDNWEKRWVSKGELEDQRYKFKGISYLWISSFIKLLKGRG